MRTRPEIGCLPTGAQRGAACHQATQLQQSGHVRARARLGQVPGGAEGVDHVQEGGLPARLQRPARPPIPRQAGQALQEEDGLLRMRSGGVPMCKHCVEVILWHDLSFEGNVHA